MNDEQAKLLLDKLERIAKVLEWYQKRIAAGMGIPVQVEGHLRTEGA